MEVAGLAGRAVNSGHVAFVLAPRINAGGPHGQRRAGPAAAAWPATGGEARALAQSLEEDNQRRRRFDEEALERGLAARRDGARAADCASILLWSERLAPGRDRHRGLAAGRALPAPGGAGRARRRARPRLGPQPARACDLSEVLGGVRRPARGARRARARGRAHGAPRRGCRSCASGSSALVRERLSPEALHAAARRSTPRCTLGECDLRAGRVARPHVAARPRQPGAALPWPADLAVRVGVATVAAGPAPAPAACGTGPARAEAIGFGLGARADGGAAGGRAARWRSCPRATSGRGEARVQLKVQRGGRGLRRERGPARSRPARAARGAARRARREGPARGPRPGGGVLRLRRPGARRPAPRLGRALHRAPGGGRAASWSTCSSRALDTHAGLRRAAARRGRGHRASRSADVEKHFGREVRGLVDGVTKISGLHFDSQRGASRPRTSARCCCRCRATCASSSSSSADRLHNMRTLEYLPRPTRRERIARETRDIYAPLAHRLGMARHQARARGPQPQGARPGGLPGAGAAHPGAPRSERERFLGGGAGRGSRRASRRSAIKAEVTGRPKHFYSIYMKMRAGRDFDEHLRPVRAAHHHPHAQRLLPRARRRARPVHARSRSASRTTSPRPRATCTSRCTPRCSRRAARWSRCRSAPATCTAPPRPASPRTTSTSRAGAWTRSWTRKLGGFVAQTADWQRGGERRRVHGVPADRALPGRGLRLHAAARAQAAAQGRHARSTSPS